MRGQRFLTSGAESVLLFKLFVDTRSHLGLPSEIPGMEDVIFVARKDLNVFSRRGLPMVLVFTAAFLLCRAPLAQVAPAKNPSEPAADIPREAVPKPRVFELGEPPTSATLALLKEIEARHGHLKTLQAEFQQEKTSVAFEEKIDSRGTVYLEMPDRLRCDYEDPEPSTVWLVGQVSYQVSPSIKQVDKFTYATPEEAHEQFRLMLLGFGLSSTETLRNYEVRLVEEQATGGDKPAQAGGKTTRVLVFRPLDPEVGKSYKDFRVWLNDQLLPEKVRYEEVSGDVTLLTIRKIMEDDPIKAKVFEPWFPRSYEVIEH